MSIESVKDQAKHTLPDLDGLSLCVLIRQDASFSQTAIVMLTDQEHEGEMGRVLDCGADDYLLRQSNLNLVLPRLRAVLRRTSFHKRIEFPNQHRIIESGRLRVDLIGHSAYVGSKELQLSQKEYELLAKFIQHPGIALSRDFLISKVWGNAEMINSRTLDVHVRWLRQKIEDDPSRPNQIVTIRSVGYRFNHTTS